MRKEKLKKLGAIMLAIALTVSMVPVSALAAERDVVVYGAESLENRSINEIAQQYSAARMAGETYSEDDRSTWYSTPASTVAPYAAGVVTDDTLLAMRSMTNFYRWLVGVDGLKDVTYHSDESLQAQALDRNFQFDHYISNSSKPADMDQDLWNQGVDCDHNILARYYTPMGAITGWMNEGYRISSQSWDTIGHRYALISAAYSDVKFGYSGRVAIGKNTEYNGTMGNKSFAAFPAPGYMPTELVVPSYSSWSVQLNSNMMTVDTKAVTVTITKSSTGESYTRTVDEGTVQATANTINFVQPPVEDESYSGKYSGEYSVVISGLKDKATGKDAEIRYTTNFVEITGYAPSYVTETASDISQYVIYKTMAGSLDKIVAILPDKVTVTAETGATATVPVSGAWTIEKTDDTNGYFVNSASADDLPEILADKNGKLERIAIPYRISSDYYDRYNTFSFYSENIYNYSEIPAGTDLQFRIWPTSGYNRGQVFKLIADEDNTYSAEMAFDTNTDAWEELNDYIVFNHKVTEEDNGEYISVYYSGFSGSPSAVYVSTSTRTLKVLPCEHSYNEGEITTEATCGEPGIKTYTCSVCGGTKEEDVPATGEHTYGEGEVTKEATCGEPGIKTYTCTVCGATKEEGIPATGKHTYNEGEVTKEPTCIHTGVKTHKCTVCGALKDEEIPATGEHTYNEGEITKEPTCVAEGIKTYTCTVCGASKYEAIAATGEHTYNEGEVTKAPTCVAEGAKTYTCTVCGASKYEAIAATGEHTYNEGEITKEPTCVAEGVKTYTCTVCRRTKNEKISATGIHAYDEGKVTKEPVCGASGVRTYTCTVCGETEVEEIAATGVHIYDEGKVTKAPTCGLPGIKTFTCTVCEAIKTEAVTATGEHVYNEGEVTTEPTCVTEGVKTRICTVCGAIKTEAIATTGKHVYDEGKVTTEPTCVVEGVKIYTCTVCGGTKEEKIPATGKHIYDEGQVTTEPTCKDMGVMTYTCTVCGDIYTDKIPVIDKHIYDEGKVTTEPTCVDKGTKIYTCTVCGRTYTEIISANGHNYVSEITKQATCTEAGERTYTCTKCGYFYTEDIPADGHNYTSEVTRQATCTEVGERTYICTKCGDFYTEEIAATGEHIYDEGKVTTEATCIGKGIMTFTCKDCGVTYTEEIPPTGKHIYDEGKIIKEAGCIEPGAKLYNCTVCDDTYIEPIPAVGHTYGEPEFTWADDFSCIATFVCKEKDDTVKVDCAVTRTTTPATEEETAKIVYTAAVTFGGVEYIDRKSIELPITDLVIERDQEDQNTTDAVDKTYTLGSGVKIKIHCSGALEHFISVSVDSNPVDSANYTLEGDSTLLTFNSDYLDTLSVGVHDVTLYYLSGYYTTENVSVTLTILDSSNSKDNQGTMVNGQKDSKTDKITSARTGDQANVAMCVVFMILAAFGAVTIVIYKRKY